MRYAASMTRALGKPRPVPYIDVDDLINLAADLGAGYFPAADLYDWHVQLIKEEDREPVSKTKFGLALKEAEWKNEVMYIGGRTTRCWLINKPWARKGQEKLKKELEENQES